MGTGGRREREEKEAGERERETRSTCTLQNLRQICSYLLASDGDANTFIPFKETRTRVASSALMKSSPGSQNLWRLRPRALELLPSGFSPSSLRIAPHSVLHLSFSLSLCIYPFTLSPSLVRFSLSLYKKSLFFFLCFSLFLPAFPHFCHWFCC